MMEKLGMTLREFFMKFPVAIRIAWACGLVAALFGFVPATVGLGVTAGIAGVVSSIVAVYQAQKNRPAKKLFRRRKKDPMLIIAGMTLVVTFGLLLSTSIVSGVAAENREATLAAQTANEKELAEKKAEEQKEKREREAAEKVAKKKAAEAETKRIAAMEASDPTSAPDAANSSALDVLEKLVVKGRAPKTGYDRDDQFGAAWLDVDHNGCDTRNDILKRDLEGETFEANNCVVLTGTLNEPYTATVIDFKKGEGTSSKVQIDHVVALSDAWQKGAQQLTLDQRKNLANDPYNLLAVDGPANAQKSDSDAASWLPANKDFRCEYVARQIGVKSKYSLWVTDAEKTAMKNVLNGCPGQMIPANGGADVEIAQPEPVQQPAPVQTPAPQPAQPAQPTPAAPAPQSTYYANCAAVRAAGAAPIYAGQPGYSTKLDRDRDGVGCEN